MEPHMNTCSVTKYLASWSVIYPFLQCMLHCNNFQHFIDQMDLEHVYNDQLFHIYKTQYMLLYFFQYLYSPASCS